jgi:phosphoribosyl 1,2-cyclic phosphate phosphodiesterase
MRVTLLGTGGSAGVPMIGGADGSGDWGACDPAEPRNRRTRSSIVIENSYNQRLLIDTSPDMRAQFLANCIPGADAVLFTHAHADHITGIDDVRILNRIARRPLGLRNPENPGRNDPAVWLRIRSMGWQGILPSCSYGKNDQPG